MRTGVNSPMLMLKPPDFTGAMVGRPKFLGEHLGICLNPSCTEIRHTHAEPGYPVTVPASMFSPNGDPINVKGLPVSPAHARMSVYRAMDWPHLFSMSAECEDLAYYAFTGEARSPQRNGWL